MIDDSRYIIGIDLGTTNSAVSYVDTSSESVRGLYVQQFQIPQVVSKERSESHATLPSCCFLPIEGEWCVGRIAEHLGQKTPTRLVQSAKSWLSNSAAKRQERILPPEGREEDRLKPVEAVTKVLAHLRNAWNKVMAKDPEWEMERSQVVLTIPASFDEVARNLTLEAAQRAGLVSVKLLEEPQAAFYQWILQNEGRFEKELQVGDCILVVDIGGGTSDFSLISVEEKGDKLHFKRIFVGRHLLLGGENMDNALCYHLGKDLELDTSQWLQLKLGARRAKEQILSGEKEKVQFVIQRGGSGVVGGSISLELKRQDVDLLLTEGFFAKLPLEEALKLNKGSGVKKLGLPFEDEPSMTKHLASFLERARTKTDAPLPTHILFNGGTMKPAVFQERVADSIADWYGIDRPKVLYSQSLDLAVSRGASYYGRVQRGLGVSIAGGSSSAFYVGISQEGEERALTLLPKGADTGTAFEPETVFALTPNQPVTFPFFSSEVRYADQSGDLVPIDFEELHPMPPLQTVLRLGKRDQPIPVKLAATLTEVGTCELTLHSQETSHVWTLAFQVRGDEVERAQDEVLEHDVTHKACGLIRTLYDPKNTSLKPGKIIGALEEVVGRSRQDFPPSLLRRLFKVLMEVADKRFLSIPHEARFWNLAGYFLRPGFGYPLDDHRVKEVWRVLLGDLAKSKPAQVEIQRLIALRRIAGGLSKGQQCQVMPAGFEKAKTAEERYLYAEKVRCMGAFERVDLKTKLKVAAQLLQRLNTPEELWALGRIGARHLVAGSLADVVPRALVAEWVAKLIKLPVSKEIQLTLSLLARRSDHMEVNLPKALITSVIEAYPDLEKPLTEVVPLSHAEEAKVFADQLPHGLSLSQSVATVV